MVIDANEVVAVDFGVTGVNEVIQNVRTLLQTVKYSVPMDRSIGISGTYIDGPINIATAKLAAEVYELIKDNEPRAKVLGVEFSYNSEENILVPKVRVDIHV